MLAVIVAVVGGSAGCTTSTTSPEPDALLIPLASEGPRLDRVIGEEEWSEAQVIRGDFAVRRENQTDIHPFEVRFRHDGERVYAAIRVLDISPTSADGITYTQAFAIFIAEPGAVDAADLKVFHNFRERGSATDDGSWTGAEWSMGEDGTGGQIDEDGVPSGGTLGRGGYADREINWEASWPLQDATPADPVDFRSGALIRVAFKLYLPDETAGRRFFDAPHAIFPRDAEVAAGPASSGWILMRIA